jgi:hypothetical protein
MSPPADDDDSHNPFGPPSPAIAIPRAQGRRARDPFAEDRVRVDPNDPFSPEDMDAVVDEWLEDEANDDLSTEDT